MTKMAARKKNRKKKEEEKNNFKEYEFLKHTADVKFRAYGKGLEDAFCNAAKATVAVMTDIKKIEPRLKRKIIAEANTREALLYDFLEEVIFLVDTEGFLLCGVKKLKIKSGADTETYKYILEADVEGDSAARYDVHTYVKAVTYNEMKIEEKKGRVVLQVVHDI
jgi:SHS2 domain-containing protein